jgi:hypothetical protein
VFVHQQAESLIPPRRALPRTSLTPSHLIEMEQTVAEAVAAATQQQQAAAQQAQQLISQPSPPVQQVQNASSTIDNLTCQWQGCGERCDSAEALYVSTHSFLHVAQSRRVHHIASTLIARGKRVHHLNIRR